MNRKAIWVVLKRYDVSTEIVWLFFSLPTIFSFCAIQFQSARRTTDDGRYRGVSLSCPTVIPSVRHNSDPPPPSLPPSYPSHRQLGVGLVLVLLETGPIIVKIVPREKDFQSKCPKLNNNNNRHRPLKWIDTSSQIERKKEKGLFRWIATCRYKNGAGIE